MKQLILSIIFSVVALTSFGQLKRAKNTLASENYLKQIEGKNAVLKKQPLMLTVMVDSIISKKYRLMNSFRENVFKADCTPEMQAFNEKAISYARTVVASKVFEEVLWDKMENLYGKCNGDPFYASDLKTQFQKVLAACRASNSVHVSCSGGSGNASSVIGAYDLVKTPEFAWSSWLTNAATSAKITKVCTDEQKASGNASNCRWAPFPWPYSQAAGIVWHELMHQYGYGHGSNNTNDEAITGCGINVSNTNWHFQINTIPYIVESAINEIIDKSQRICGDISNCPESNQLRLLDTYNGTTCSCVTDPVKKGFQLAAPEMASQSGSITAVSRRRDHIETFWIGGDGSIWASSWYKDIVPQRHTYQLAPPKMASQSGGITVLSRREDHMEIFWIGGDGSVWASSFYESMGPVWHTYQLAPAGMASHSGGITAVSRREDHMEIFWIGGDGSVWASSFYESMGPVWHTYQLAPAGMASQNGAISCVSRIQGSMEVFWIGGDGSVWDAYWYEGVKEWQRFQLAPPEIASQSGSISAVSRRTDHMEIFWIGGDGSVWDAYWYEGVKEWQRFQLAPPEIASQSGSITSVSRIPGNMEIFWIGGDGSLWSAFFNEGITDNWRRFQVASPDMTARNGSTVSISRIENHREVFWIGGDGSVWDANWYDTYLK